MADEETAMIVEGDDTDPPVGDTVGDDENGSTSGGFAFDEDTLGKSVSVFGNDVDMMAPLAPPPAPPPGPPPTGQPGIADGGDGVRPVSQMSQRERRARVKLEARRVRRIIRHIEPWSVLKLSVVFYLCLWLIFVLAGLVLWSYAESTGTLDSVEELIESLFQLEEENEFWRGGRIFQVYATVTLFLSIAGIAFNVLLCVMFNLISDLLGGIRVTVIEEESARFRPPRRR